MSLKTLFKIVTTAAILCFVLGPICRGADWSAVWGGFRETAYPLIYILTQGNAEYIDYDGGISLAHACGALLGIFADLGAFVVVVAGIVFTWSIGLEK